MNPVALVLLFILSGWGIFSSWFDSAPQEVDRGLVSEAIGTVLSEPGPRLEGHRDLSRVYAARKGTAAWMSNASRTVLTRELAEAPLDGLEESDIGISEIDRAMAAARAATSQWAEWSNEERDANADPRIAAAARLDVLLTNGLLRYGDDLLGNRIDAAKLHAGTWFPTHRDSTNSRMESLRRAIEQGDAKKVTDAIDSFRPRHRGYRLLRARLAALQDATLGPVPDGDPLLAGERSVRVPHLRGRLSALGFMGSDTLGAGWTLPDPYVFTDDLAGALARFEFAHDMDADSVLDNASVQQLNGDLNELRETLAINLERWRWLPDNLGEHYLWVNLPAYDLRIYKQDTVGYSETLRMPVNIGNAQTIGWTTPVITDSIHTVEFQPAWYVPASLVASNVIPMAKADSLSLYRQGFEVTLNGRPVDSRLVKWDSVSTAGFRFVQRPGPANPLGRVKFLMTNPYAILIHDTNKRQSFADGRGGILSSGCIHAGNPEALAEYLLTNLNGWKEGEASAAYRGGPRRGVRLDHTMLSHFVYFTAWVDDDGALRLTDDPYGYDKKLRSALGMAAQRDVPEATS